MENTSNTPVKALQFTSTMAENQDEIAVEDLIRSVLPEINLRKARYHQIDYEDNGNDYVALQLLIFVHHSETDLPYTFVLHGGDWLVEDPDSEYGFKVTTDREYRSR